MTNKSQIPQASQKLTTMCASQFHQQPKSKDTLIHWEHSGWLSSRRAISWFCEEPQQGYNKDSLIHWKYFGISLTWYQRYWHVTPPPKKNFKMTFSTLTYPKWPPNPLTVGCNIIWLLNANLVNYSSTSLVSNIFLVVSGVFEKRRSHPFRLNRTPISSQH